jgi:hypothetical protein
MEKIRRSGIYVRQRDIHFDKFLNSDFSQDGRVCLLLFNLKTAVDGFVGAKAA